MALPSHLRPQGGNIVQFIAGVIVNLQFDTLESLNSVKLIFVTSFT